MDGCRNGVNVTQLLVALVVAVFFKDRRIGSKAAGDNGYSGRIQPVYYLITAAA
jgi:hypothetical protein